MLIVIVIIGILAAITIVSYSGISKRVIDATLQSDLSAASTKLKLYQVDNMAYPTLINNCPTPTAGNICLKASPGNTYSYSVVNTTNPQTFSLTGTNTNGGAYVVTHDSSPVATVPAAPVVAHPQTFSVTANYTVPTGVTSVTLECWGGVDPEWGNRGGYAKGDLAVTSGDVLNVKLFYGGYDDYEGMSCSVNRVAGPNLLLAVAGASNDYEDYPGYGLIYAGLTNTSTASANNVGAQRAVITYTTGG